MASFLQPARFSYDEERATQLAGYIIQKAGREASINYTALLKLMYMIERGHLLEANSPIFGGQYVSMDQGPLSSETYDRIKTAGEGRSYWDDHIEKEGRYRVRLRRSTTDSQLTARILRIADEVLREHGDKSWEELSDFCHQHFKEWEHPAGSSQAIAYEAVLEAAGHAKDIEQLKLESREREHIERVFG